MINFKICFKKNLRKYIFIFVFLFLLSLFFCCLIKSIDNKIIIEENKPQYRTIIINLGDYENIKKDIKSNEEIIENYEYNVEKREISITFVSVNTLNDFLNKYEDNFISIIKENFSNSNYYIARNIFKTIMIISIILTTALMVIFSISFIYNLEKDIALYKLLGFSNKKILSLIFTFMYLLYITTYFSSIIIVNIGVKLINYFNISIIEKMNFIQLGVKEYLYMFAFFSIVDLLSFIRIIIKVKKISPIKFIKSY